MEKQEAFGIISQVCNSFKGNLQDHNLIQTALKILTPEPTVKSVNQTGGITAKTVVDSKSK